jgi:hypothetical protein
MTVRTRRITWMIFLFFQALYALTSSGNAFRVPDEFEVYYQTEHLVDAGDLTVPQALDRRLFFGRIGRNGLPYAPYGPLTAVLAVPHHVIGRTVARLIALPRGSRSWTFLVSGFTMLSTATGAALAVAGFFTAARILEVVPGTALLLSMLLGGATVLWAYGASLYSEAWQAAAFIWAAVYLLQKRVAPAAVLLVAGGLVKFTSLVFAPGFVVAALADRSAEWPARLKAAAALAGAIALALALHLLWNTYRFGSPAEFGYDWGETVPVLPARAFLLTDLPRGLTVLLLSPGKSLFLWAPVLWLAVARFRDWPYALKVGVLVSTASGLLFYGAYLFPEGGYAHGPRHLVPLIPLLLLPAAASNRPWRRSSVLACLAVGATLAVMSVSVSFLQDQAMGTDFSGVGYYDRIAPAPGRAWNRYHMGYVPFARTIAGTAWPRSASPGAGVDFFWLHLARARHGIPEAQMIPAWLPWSLPVLWLLLLAVSGRAIFLYAGTQTAAPGPPVIRAVPQ